MSTAPTTAGEARRRPGGPTRSREVLSHPDLRRLGMCLAAGLVLAVMSGPQGRPDEPTYAIRAALDPSRAWKFLVAGVVLWAILTAATSGYGKQIAGLVRVASEDRRVTGRPARYTGYAVALTVAIVVPPLLSEFWQGVLVDRIGIFILLAIGLHVVVGLAGLLDLGYIAFYAIGAYVTAYFTGSLPVEPVVTLNVFYIIPLATLGAMIAGFILGGPTLRLRGDYLAIVTLGFGELVHILAINLDSITNGSRGASGVPPFSVDAGPVQYEWGLESLPYWYLLLGFTIVVLITFRLLEESRVGRAWTAIREDEVAAQACGIPTVKYKLLAFVIGASTSGFAGVLFASKVGYVGPSSFALTTSILVLVLVIFGGMGSIWGAVAGAAVIMFLPEWLRDYITPQDLFIYIGALLIIMMIFRPQGVLPSKRRSREIQLAEHGVGGADAMGAPAGGPTS